MSMSLQSVIGSLQHEARMAMAAAETTPDYAAVVVSMEKARRWRDMAAAVRLALDTPAAAPKARRRSVATAGPPDKARSTVAPIGALAFWAAHGQAVAAITAEYGARWRVAAPFGATEIVTLASKLATCTTERGTKLKWGKDHRIPAARFWPGGTIPAGVTVEPDYARAVGRYIAVKDDHGCYSKLAFDPPETPFDAAWHIAHGYVWIAEDTISASHAKYTGLFQQAAGGWVFEIEARAEASRIEAIEEAREYRKRAALEAAALSYGPQPMPVFADIADDLAYADAAD